MTKTTTDPSHGRVRPSFRRAALVATAASILLIAAACSPSSDTTTDADGPATTVAAGATSTSTVDAGEGIDVRALLSEALARYEDGYEFDAVAEVDGAEAANVSGVVIGDKAQMTITSGDATVTYIITPDQSWIQSEGGEWQEDESGEALERPLDDLASPNSITIVSADDGGISAVGIYDGAAFESDGPVELNLRFVDGFLVKASYTTELASVTTTFAPLGDQVIVVPVPSA